MRDFFIPKELAERWHPLTVETLANWRYLCKGPKFTKRDRAVFYSFAEISRFEKTAEFRRAISLARARSN